MTGEPAFVLPPIPYQHLRWHWIEHATMQHGERVWPRIWHNSNWVGHNNEMISQSLAAGLGWRYRGPCIPDAIVVDPVTTLQRVKDRIDSLMNGHLCDMKPDYDDSVTGFNEAWEIARDTFAEALTGLYGQLPQSIRRAALDEAIAAVSAEDMHDETDDPADAAYSRAIRDCRDVLTALRDAARGAKDAD
jgi:hypothetical protein